MQQVERFGAVAASPLSDEALAPTFAVQQFHLAASRSVLLPREDLRGLLALLRSQSDPPQPGHRLALVEKSAMATGYPEM
jgi:hypothetical protein